MNLEAHYDQLWHDSQQKFKREEFEFDPHIDSEEDNRYGITLLARPSQEVKRNVLDAIENIKTVAPNQYYYPDSALHVTVLSIISCYRGFSLDQIDEAAYTNLIRSSIAAVRPFRMQFRGITASPSCILVQGFPEDDQLNRLRENLRIRFDKSDLQHTIDARYRLETAHMTMIRFKEPFEDVSRFVETVTNLRAQNFGSCVIEELELVGNDWYQQKQKVQLIDAFDLQ